MLPFYWNCLNSSSHVSCVYPVRDIRAYIFFVFFRDLFSIYFFLCVFIHSLYPPTTSQIVFFITPNLLYSVLVSFVLHPSRFIFIISSSIVISNANYKFHLSCLTLKLLKIEAFRKILFLSRREKSFFSRGRRGTDNKGRGEAMLINFVIAPRISDGRHIDGSRPTSRS